MISGVIPYAALTGPLPKVGVIVVAVAAAAVLLVREPRVRALAAVVALILSPVLLLTDIWHSPQLRVVHHHPLLALIAGVIVVVVLGGAARLAYRRFDLLGPLAVLALPFRVPIQAGGTTANLLVPLYLVVAVAAVAWIVPALRDGAPPGEAPAPPSDGAALWMERLLALYVVLYGIQAVYSPSFEKALQNMVFFYVPFTLLYVLLRSLRWDAAMIRRCLGVLVGLALVFAVVAYVEYATKTIILNPKLVVTNDLHTYFTVNSVFFDPDIFGRFLALVMVLVAVTLLYPRPVREQGVAVGVLAALWVALVLTLSRSSLGALLLGMGVLAALRWKPSRALVVAVVVVVLGGLAVVISPTTFGLNQGLNGASSGRGGLVSGGISLFANRPGWGYGSGSFIQEYRVHNRAKATTLSASHTIPVTIAAEQGLIGELAYVAFVLCAIVCLVRRARGDPLRSALAAAFVALVFHTLLYADFLEDPTTWALLGIGISLALARPRAGVVAAAKPVRPHAGLASG
jgi:O-antigen ligase